MYCYFFIIYVYSKECNMKYKDFDKFYAQNIDRIYRYVYFRVAQNHDIAEDNVSEIFMKALKNFEKYDPKISKSAWIYQIAHNHLSNYYRDKKDTVNLEKIQFYLVGDDGMKQMDDMYRDQKMYQALDKLNDNDKEVVTFKYLLGYTYAEIGKIKGKTTSSVKMASHRALKKLKTHLTDL